MKKRQNRYFGEEIIEIFGSIGKIIESFLKSGITKQVVSWIKDVESWAGKNSDEELLNAIVKFCEWKDKDELKKLILIIEKRHQSYLSIESIKNNVFIAHNDGDPFAKELQMFLFKENFNPIIMQEQPNKGQTIIDKFKSIEFNIAIVLLVEDPQLAVEAKISQAKQNVILEAGYCYGYLENISEIIIMHDGKVKIPSNIGAVEYIKIDENWKYNLTRSLKARGLMEA